MRVPTDWPDTRQSAQSCKAIATNRLFQSTDPALYPCCTHTHTYSGTVHSPLAAGQVHDLRTNLPKTVHVPRKPFAVKPFTPQRLFVRLFVNKKASRNTRREGVNGTRCDPAEAPGHVRWPSHGQDQNQPHHVSCLVYHHRPACLPLCRPLAPHHFRLVIMKIKFIQIKSTKVCATPQCVPHGRTDRPLIPLSFSFQRSCRLFRFCLKLKFVLRFA